MANNPKLAVARRNEALNTILAHANSGLLRIYDGTKATDADTAIGAQVLLAELTMNATAFAAAASGFATANAITSDASANATGTASWFRLVKSDGTTVILDGSAGVANADLILTSAVLTAGSPVAVASFVVTFPA